MTLWILLIVFCLAIAPAQAQNLFVANQAGNTIREFSPSGVDLGDFATTGLSAPRGIAFDKRGNLYVANAVGPGAGWIRKFSPAGEDLGNFATTGLNIPRGIAFDKKGNLYAANAGDNTIRVFSRMGKDLATSPPPESSYPRSSHSIGEATSTSPTCPSTRFVSFLGTESIWGTSPPPG